MGTFYMLNFAQAHCLLLILSVKHYSMVSARLTIYIGTVYEKKPGPMTQFSIPDIWKRYAELLNIRVGNSNTNVSRCLGINLRTVQGIRKGLYESSADYEGRAARKTHSDRFDKIS